MSLKFNWRFFDVQDLQARCEEAFTQSIAKTRRPPVIAEPIRATGIDFGTQPPEIVFVSIPEVSLNRTHIVFSLKYHGDAALTLETGVQANPLREVYFYSNFPKFVKPRIVGSLEGLVLPFRLKIKDIVLDTMIDVVYTPNGVVVVFHEDPVKHVEVESSLDMVPGVNKMISEILQKSLIEAFEEDIPESVWANTNPNHTPPTPHFGARRWSQHMKTFVKFTNHLVPPPGPTCYAVYPPFMTLSLNTVAPELVLPRAISSRACLPGTKGVDRTISRDEVLKTESLQQFLLDASSGLESRIFDSMSVSSKGSETRPRRRVIKMKRAIEASASPEKKKTPEASPMLVPSTPSSTFTSAASTPHSKTPRAASSPIRTSSRHSHSPSAVPQRSASTSGPPPLPRVALFQQSTECATIEEDELEPLLPPTLNWEHHRRFSSPEKGEYLHPRERTGSMEPSKTCLKQSISITSQPGSRQESTVRRSPQRYPSTHDLIDMKGNVLDLYTEL